MSRFCPNCGKAVGDQDSFCVHCGEVLDNTVTQQASNAYVQGTRLAAPQNGPQPSQPFYYPQPKQNNTLLYVIIAVLVCLVIGGGAFFFFSSSKDKNDQEAQQKEQADSLKKELNSLKQETADAKASAQKATQAANAKVVVKQHAAHAAEHRAVSAGGGSSSGAKVVINGSGVRMRFAPSLDSGYLTWGNGATRAPKKGARLTYLGENDDWYQVYYLGEIFYVSKEYSYLEY